MSKIGAGGWSQSSSGLGGRCEGNQQPEFHSAIKAPRGHPVSLAHSPARPAIMYTWDAGRSPHLQDIFRLLSV